MKLVTASPVSACTICASSNSVVSAGSVLIKFPPEVCNLNLAWLYSTFGLGAGAAAGAGAGAEALAAASGTLPSLAAFASSALRRLSALSASILALMRFLASRSAAFS